MFWLLLLLLIDNERIVNCCRRTRIDEVAPSDCSQDANGQWTCFFQNTAKDCESGDIIRWDSQEEATRYPVQCRNPAKDAAATAGEAAEGEGGRQGGGRPFSYQQGDLSDAEASVDPRATESSATRESGDGGADLYRNTGSSAGDDAAGGGGGGAAAAAAEGSSGGGG